LRRERVMALVCDLLCGLAWSNKFGVPWMEDGAHGC
jgi:hypothetical protein